MIKEQIEKLTKELQIERGTHLIVSIIVVIAAIFGCIFSNQLWIGDAWYTILYRSFIITGAILCAISVIRQIRLEDTIDVLKTVEKELDSCVKLVDNSEDDIK